MFSASSDFDRRNLFSYFTINCLKGRSSKLTFKKKVFQLLTLTHITIEIDRILDNVIYGEIKILYISPERISSKIF